LNADFDLFHVNILKKLRAILQAELKVQKLDFLGYKPTRSTTPENWTSKIEGDMEAFKKGYWGRNIEGTLKSVDLEKILSRTYSGRIFLKLHI
jgi:hypothetical protein